MRPRTRYLKWCNAAKACVLSFLYYTALSTIIMIIIALDTRPANGLLRASWLLAPSQLLRTDL